MIEPESKHKITLASSLNSRGTTMKAKLLILLSLSFVLLSLSFVVSANAGSATWNANPVDNQWNNPANWTPNTVPNGPGDVATFGASAITSISLTSPVELHSLVLNSGASAFTFSMFGGSTLTLSGTGIVNNSGIIQNFVDAGTPQSGYGKITFNGFATAGSQTMFTNNGGPTGGAIGLITFNDSASAADATFVAFGGYMYFYDQSTADNATIIVNGTSSSDVGWSLVSLGSGTAANATLIATSGDIAGGDIGLGLIGFEGPNTARVQVYGKGYLLAYSGNIGSLEGDGLVIIEPDGNLHIGGNNLSTTFSGKIKGDTPFTSPEGAGDLNGACSIGYNEAPNNQYGAVTKEGTGTLSLRGIGTYGQGTTITAGTLLVANSDVPGTGKGPVNVTGGTLGGGGMILGRVTIGAGSFLAPASGTKTQATLTIQSILTLQADATYTCTFKARGSEAITDLVIANEVTITGANIQLKGKTSGSLTEGLVLTLISNTSANPITGTFSNLPDGGIVNVNGNKLQASYSGGDGNDLTLTVVP
jgi:autotransporter-associated beta strand protein